MSNRQIETPIWGDKSKTNIVCTFVYEDGLRQTASISNEGGDNPDWVEVLEQFSEEDIDNNTSEVKKEKKNAEKVKLASEADKQERSKNEALFQAKIDAFQLQEVKDSKDKVLKSKIRKATSLLQVYVYTGAIVMKSSE